MAGYEKIDKSDNEVPGRMQAKVNRMLRQLFGLPATGPGLGYGTAAVPLNSIQLDSGTKTAAATAGAATLNKSSGVVTSEALTTAAAGTYTMTITNSKVAAADVVQVTLAKGTSTTGAPALISATPGAGVITLVIQNVGTVALNGTIKAMFTVFKN